MRGRERRGELLVDGGHDGRDAAAFEDAGGVLVGLPPSVAERRVVGEAPVLLPSPGGGCFALEVAEHVPCLQLLSLAIGAGLRQGVRHLHVPGESQADRRRWPVEPLGQVERADVRLGVQAHVSARLVRVQVG